MSTETCAACRYYITVESKRGTEEELGECRRYPPTVCSWDEEGGQFQGRPFVWASVLRRVGPKVGIVKFKEN